MKKKLLMPFESPREKYRADATVVWCFDDRFSLALQVLAGKIGWKNFDLIKVAGGARDLGSFAEQDPASSNYLLGQIGKSVKVNHSPEIFLMAHYNCVSYGREQMDPTDDEDEFFVRELEKAKTMVEQYLIASGLKANVRLLLADFKNVYEVSQ